MSSSSSVFPTASRACLAATVLLVLLTFAPGRTGAATIVDVSAFTTDATSAATEATTPVATEATTPVATEATTPAPTEVTTPGHTEVTPVATESTSAATETVTTATDVTAAVTEATSVVTEAVLGAFAADAIALDASTSNSTAPDAANAPDITAAETISIDADPSPSSNTTDTSNAPDVDISNNGLIPDSGLPSINLPTPLPPTLNKNGDIYSFIIHSKIKYRYAQTVVSSRVANKGNTSHEVQFYVTLPESAFVSKFLMEINEKVYEAYVKEKKEAKEEYITAINLGQTAAHVEQNARDSNKFTVSVNVEAESKVTFNLTYEQLLTRKLGIYENVINVQPGQVVKNLQVIVDIEESSNITTLEVPDIKTVNEIETKTSRNKLAQIHRESGNKATITWSPTVKEQLTFTERGVIGQFIIQYDVDHKATPNQVLVDDGYFVHFFAPTDLTPLRTHVIFVLDVSGSMVGQKLPQVKEAMGQILSEIHSDDFFTLILFSDFAQVWTINATQETTNRWDDTGIPVSSNNFSLEALGEYRFVFPATEENIQYAKKFIQDLTSESSTNMEDALSKAHGIAKLGETRFKDGSNTPKPIIVFLTDGEPTTGITEPQELIRYVSNTNEEKYPIYSLGFGEGADIDFLKKLSLNNSGFARVIYEASDASLQLRNFYKEISSPVLSNVTFKYIDTQVDNVTVTKKSFNLLFSGTELVVAGKLKDAKSEINSTLYADSTEGIFNDSTIVTCFDYPITPLVPTPQSRRIGHLEKLWAYLYIQQLMDTYELNKNENSTAKAKALELALEYSFVTPLTSLIVVKPNDTTTSAGPEKIKPHDRYFDVSGASLASAAGYSQKLGPPSVLNMYATPVQYILPTSTKVGHVYSLQMSSRPAYAYVPEDTDISASEIVDFTSVSTTSVVDSPQPLDLTNSTLLHNISEIKWLSVSNNTQTSIKLNATDYEVLLNTTAQTYQNCTTPDDVPGNCKHLKDCVVTSILNSLDVYTSLFCSIENIYAGICCLV